MNNLLNTAGDSQPGRDGLVDRIRSGEEVAQLMHIPEATVRRRFFRARAQLREALARDIDFAMEDAFSFDGERCDRIVAGVLQALTNPPNYSGDTTWTQE